MKLILGTLSAAVFAGVLVLSCSVKDPAQIIQEAKRSKKIAEHQKRTIHKSESASFTSNTSAGPMQFPVENWNKIDPSSLGWDMEQLEAAKEYYEQLNADAVMIVQGGYEIASWGNVSKLIEVRSMRKSFLGTLYGIYEEKGSIVLDETLKSIGIDEKGGLTEIEKTATVRDLLASRSGIFLPAAYDPNDHPPRGKYKPNEIWAYNNWDFNALATIFEKKTKKKIFETFETDIARPLQMQDFNVENTEYRYENISLHPAYLFQTSARDDARMGLLWLNKGKWADTQIVPSEWIEKCTSIITDFQGKNSLSLRDGYGYLFWIDKDELGEQNGFSALGASGQYIYVNPKNELIIVFRADPGSIFKKWFGLRVQPEESYPLVDLILAAAPGK